MGYVKLLKAGGEFDLLPAEDIGLLSISGSTIVVSYVFGNKITITMASVPSFGIDGDDQLLLSAVEKINGASGPGVFPATLSSLVTGTQVTAL
jgi:hypothetical protein